MQALEPKIALGLYSDPSAVYINAALIRTDGIDIFDKPITLTRPYSNDLREEVLNAQDLTDSEGLKTLQKKMTRAHIEVAQELLTKSMRQFPKIDVVGYSGYILRLHTADRIEVSLGDGYLIAKTLKIPTIDRFVLTDLQAGGVGGPLLTTFWESVLKKQKKPLAVIDLSGISTLIYIGALGDYCSFDIGVGCLLLDKWIHKHTGSEMDFDGTWAERGQVNQRLLDFLLKTPYLAQKPPKALDRDAFNHLLEHVEGCSPADGAATLTAFIIQNIVNATAFLPEYPTEFIITGGGTLNPTLMLRLKKALKGTVRTITELGMPEYNLDGAGYAFLAVRSLAWLPITFPDTTGLSFPMTGGLYHSPTEE